MKEIHRPATYLELPSILEALTGLTEPRTVAYIKYVDAEGFDLPVSGLQGTAKKILEDPTALQYITIKVGEERAFMDFEFRKGQSNLVFEDEYAGIVENTLHQIDNLKDKSLRWFLSAEGKEHLANILMFETGRFLSRCVDDKGRLWVDSGRSRYVGSHLQAGITILVLAQSFTGSPFAATMIDSLCKEYGIRIEELRERAREDFILQSVLDIDEKDKTARLVHAVLVNRDRIIDLLRVRNAAGYWTLRNVPHAPMTAVAYETSSLALKKASD